MSLYQAGFAAAFICYFTSFIIYFLNFELKNDLASVWGKRMLWSGFLLQLGWFCFLCTQAYSPKLATLSGQLYLITLIIVAASLVLEWRYRMNFLMLFSLPATLVLLFMALVTTGHAPSESGPAPQWLWFHAGFILFGTASFAISVASALMYLLQSKQIKSKHPGRPFLKLPALAALDELHFISLSLGTALFSVGILGGFLWANEIQALGAILGDFKAQVSLLCCLMYWAILGLRMSPLRREHQIVVGTVALFVFLSFAFLGGHSFSGKTV